MDETLTSILRIFTIPRSQDPRFSDQGLYFRDHATALAFLRRNFTSQGALASLRAALSERCVETNVWRMDDAEVLERAAVRLGEGGFKIVETIVELPSAPSTPAKEEETEQEEFVPITPAPVKTWIEFELVNEAGQPAAGERYKLVPPTGKPKEGNLDSLGRVRVNELDPGTWKISFPDLVTRNWGD